MFSPRFRELNLNLVHAHAALYKEYCLDPMTVDFIGHALALHRHAFAGVKCQAAMQSAPLMLLKPVWPHQGV